MGSPMTVYVAEIFGSGIAAFDAASAHEARAHLTDEGFQRDLIVMQSKGRPLWDGVAEIHVRIATPEESVIWQTGLATATQSTDFPGDRTRHVFLVPVVDPSLERSVDDDDDDDRD